MPPNRLRGEVEAGVGRHVLIGGHLEHLRLELLLIGGDDASLRLDDDLLSAASRLRLKLPGVLPVSLSLLGLIVAAAGHLQGGHFSYGRR